MKIFFITNKNILLSVSIDKINNNIKFDILVSIFISVAVKLIEILSNFDKKLIIKY